LRSSLGVAALPSTGTVYRSRSRLPILAGYRVLSTFGRGAHLEIVGELPEVFAAQNQHLREVPTFERSRDLLSLPFLTTHSSSRDE